MIGRLLRRQTQASFDYQWRELPRGVGLASDAEFVGSVERVIAEELLALRREWFCGKRVLDAGCGNGRWTIGLLRLGARVTAVDTSPAGLDWTRRNVAAHCTAPERERLKIARVDLLDPPPDLRESPFDLVFSFGVLHHTGDTRRALENVAECVSPEGVLFLYLYGRASVTRLDRMKLAAWRIGLAPFPFGLKRRLISRFAAWGDPHQLFDLFSPTINDRRSFEEVESWLEELGFEDVVRTIPRTELFVRAARDATQIADDVLPTVAGLPERAF